jgi:hypothetical protein
LRVLHAFASFNIFYYSFALVVAAAGNGGNDENRPSIGSPGNSKNALTIGSAQPRNSYSDVDFAKTTVSAFSSNGPTLEGRIKPDLISVGTAVSAAHANYPKAFYDAFDYGRYEYTCSTQQLSGTSMATPQAAGAALLTRQYFEDESFWASLCGSTYSSCAAGFFSPSGYFVKAVLIHSGQTMDRYGAPNDRQPVVLGPTPDFMQGYGFLDLANVLPLPGLSQPWKLYVNDRLTVSEGHTVSWTITVAESDVSPIVVTIAWYDVFGELGGNLIHDLDLRVTSPAGKDYWGNRNLNGGDDQNPNEQVAIQSPSCSDGNCVYIVAVIGASISMADAQSFAVVMTTSGVVSEPVFATDAPKEPSLFLGSALARGGMPFAAKRAKLGSRSERTHGGNTVRVTGSPVMQRRVQSDVTTETVDLGAFTLESSTPRVFPFSVTSPQRLSTVLIEFFNWASDADCPSITRVKLTDPGGREYLVEGWPRYFDSCSFTPAVNFGYYSSLIGVDLFGLSGSGTWSVEVSFSGSTTAAELPYDVALTLGFESPDSPYAKLSASVNLEVSSAGSEDVAFQLSSVPTCGVLAYVAVQYDFRSCGGDSASDLSITLTDPTSKVVDILPLDLFDWSSTQSGAYTATAFVLSAGLGTNGRWTAVATNKGSCDIDSSATFDLYFRNSANCDEGDANIEQKVAFAVTLSNCFVQNPDWVGDGYCDSKTVEGDYNSASCDWDGGDCCAQSCVSGPEECGSNGYDCKDPAYQFTFSPTSAPTDEPSDIPTSVPSFSPSFVPTSEVPTAEPTVEPTSVPTEMPTAQPTFEPSAVPTNQPSELPTETPSAIPTVSPTITPTSTPTAKPSAVPTDVPTRVPSAVPTSVPSSFRPTNSPTAPSLFPTTVPSSSAPSIVPTSQPSSVPSAVPSAQPSSVPTAVPSRTPTATPTATPSAVPTRLPSSRTPTTRSPTAPPSHRPTRVPSTRAPTARPTARPTRVPSIRPTRVPSTRRPSARPTVRPTRRPTSHRTGVSASCTAPNPAWVGDGWCDSGL